VTDLLARRLAAQRLAGSPARSVDEAVGHLLAVQAQDWPAARWALGLRVAGLLGSDVDLRFDEGAVLRTHVMRPTWHLVPAADIGWLLALTAPKVRASCAGRYRRLGIDEATIAAARRVFEKELSGHRHRTRPELGDALVAAGIPTDGQRLPHLLMAAELDSVLCSGPLRGRQFTYALLEERAPQRRHLDRDEALGEIARRYFTGHGPARIQDLTWWSGLTVADARRAIAIAGGALRQHDIDGTAHWSAAETFPVPDIDGCVHLLPNFDEYTVGYRDREALLDARRPVDLTRFSFGSVISNVLTVGGVVRGTWRRIARNDRIELDLGVSGTLSARERRGVEAAAAAYSRFTGRPVTTRSSTI
jgi:hypothetical protein